MGERSAQWLEDHADRTLQRQRAQADTAKLVATFSTGIAAALLATALQVGDPTTNDRRAAILFAFCAVLALAVIFTDRITEANQDEVLRRSELAGGWPEDALIYQLRLAMGTAVDRNESVVTWMRSFMWGQLLAAVACGLLALLSLLQPSGA